MDLECAAALTRLYRLDGDRLLIDPADAADHVWAGRLGVHLAEGAVPTGDQLPVLEMEEQRRVHLAGFLGLGRLPDPLLHGGDTFARQGGQGLCPQGKRFVVCFFLLGGGDIREFG